MTEQSPESDTPGRPRAGAEGDGLQEEVNAHFDSSASYWDGVYRGEDLQGIIYLQRQAAVLEYVDQAHLERDAQILEIGCGAGHLTMQLADRALRVDAVDASPAMVDSTAARAGEHGVLDRVAVRVADVHELPFETDHFDLVVAVGVIPWLHSPADAVAEMARVLRPGGELVLTADNGARLVSFTDPRGLLALTPLKRVLVALRKRRGRVSSRLHFPSRIERMLRAGGLRPLDRRTVGFGPLSFLGRPLLSEGRGVRVNSRLQALADRGVPGLRLAGWHYLVRARKP
ncbi:MAG TPA: methyltransferase domain-containing protein [Solirubrobacteraceae bacterium]|jgi:SAM-dependent methyltransferase|nr:methyltransferase domain-containing protein [Solirubrobacteraceae bacterium]